MRAHVCVGVGVGVVIVIIIAIVIASLYSEISINLIRSTPDPTYRPYY